VISIDLNPLSRTSQNATISIVDNVVRAIPNMIKFTEEMGDFNRKKLKAMVENFDNLDNLKKIVRIMRRGIYLKIPIASSSMK
jgi:4-phosphopantoate--beta-alanine ligase